MAQYISKSALVAEIENRVSEVSQLEKASYEVGLFDAYKIILSFLNTLEVKEVVEAVKDAPILAMVEPKDYSSIDPHFFKPTWSEDDDEHLRRAIKATKDVYPVTANWLKSLKQRMFVS